MKSKRISLKQREHLLGYSFLSPWIIGFLVFAIYPILYSLYLSLNEVKISAEGMSLTYIGFKNFQRAFVFDRVMVLDLVNFLKDALVMIIVINVFALIFALILNLNIKGRNFFRTIFFLPVVIVSGPMINELVEQNILVLPGIADFRVIEMFSEIFGHRFGELIVNIFSRLIYMFWFSGVQIIIFLAVLQKLDKEIYEAAEIDGASPWESFWKLTLPTLKPIFLINIIYTFIMLATFSENKVIIDIKDAIVDVHEGYGYASSLAWIYFITLVLVVLGIFLIFSIRIKQTHKISFYTEGYIYNKTRYQFKPNWINKNRHAAKAKKVILGRNGLDGLLVRVFIYLLIISVGFAFFYPIIYLVLKSFHNPQDVLDPTIGLIPTKLYFGNFKTSIQVVGFWNSLWDSLKISILPSIAQVVASALIGYGLSRFNFKGKKVLIVLILFTFIIPPQILMIPTVLFYKKIGIVNSVFSIILPALFGQGLKSAIFIMIFYQFFNMIPKVLDEAAEIDGASPFKIFYRITLPLALPAIIVAFLFSFVWYWNETYLLSFYMPEIKSLPIQLSRFASSFRDLFQPDSNVEQVEDMINEAIYMAGILISMIPLLLIYFVLQRWFVEGVDRTGIVGE